MTGVEMDEGTYWSSLSTESLRLDGDRDEEKRQRNRMREEEGEEQEETLQYHQKMPHSHLAEEEGRRGRRGNEGMVGREKKENGCGESPDGKVFVIQVCRDGFDPSNTYHKTQAW